MSKFTVGEKVRLKELDREGIITRVFENYKGFIPEHDGYIVDFGSIGPSAVLKESELIKY
jgi:hypothetical protein